MTSKRTLRHILFVAAAIAAIAGLAGTATATDGTWNTDAGVGNLNWSNSSNWLDGFIADGQGATATFYFDITLARAITIDTTSRTLGALYLGDGSHVYTIAASGGANLTLDNGDSAALIYQRNPSKVNVISAPILLNSSLDIGNADGDGLTISGSITGNSSGTKTISNIGTGSGTVTISGIIADGSVGNGPVAILQNSSTSGLTLTGANTYTGATTINAGTLTVSGTAGTIKTSSGISLNGGSLTLSYGNNDTEKALDRVSDSGTITVNGGTITYTTTSATSTRIFTETIGTVAMASGQLNIVESFNRTVGSQTLTLSGLTQAGRSTVTFSAGAFNSFNMIKMAGAPQTPAEQIFAPWATTVTTANVQTDYASVDASNNIVPANIPASTEDTWTTASNAYTWNEIAATLTGTRNMAGLRYINAGTATLTLASGANLGTTGILNAGGGTLTIAPGTGGVVTLPSTDPGTLYVTTGTKGIEIAAPIQDNTGALSLVKSGTGGTLILSGVNTYTGTTTINAGTLEIGGAGQLGSGNYGAGIAILGTELKYNSSADQTLSGPITGAGAVTKAGAGTLILSGTNTYGGITTVSAGTLQVSSPGNLGTSTAADAVTLTGSTLKLLNDSSADFAKNVKVITANSNIYVGRESSGSDNTHSLGTLLLSGSGRTLTVSGDSGYGLTFGAVTADHNANLTNNAPGTLTLASFTLTTGTRTLTVAGSGNTTISGAVGGGTLSLTKTGAGTLTLAGENTHTGGTSFTGTLVVKNQNAVQNSMLTMGGSLVFDSSVVGKAFTFGGLAASAAGAGYDIALENNAGTPAAIALTVGGNNADTTYAGVFSGAGSLTKVGTGRLTLSGANIFTGGVTLNAGTLRLNTDTALGDGAGTFTINGGTLDVNAARTTPNNNPVTINSDFTFQGSNTLDLGTGAISLGSAAGPSRTITVSNRILTLGGNISDGTHGMPANALIKDGAGTLVLSGTNTYTGGTAVNAGSLSFLNTGAKPSTGTVTVEAGATLGLGVGGTGGFSSTDVANLFAGTMAGVTNDPASHVSIDTTAGNFTCTSNIPAVTKNLTKLGDNTLTLTGNNAYSGVTTVSAGMLVAGSNNALGDTGSGTTVESGAALGLQGGVTVGAEALGLSGTGISTGGALRNISGDNTYGGRITLTAVSRINSDAGTLTLDVAGGNAIEGAFNLTFGGAGNIAVADPIATETGKVTMDGAGTLILSAANTYSGTTTISAGTLAIGNDSALSTGTLALNGGTVQPYGAARTVTNNTILGGNTTVSGSYDVEFGTGTFTNSGGGRTLTNNLDSGSTLTLSGTVNLTDNTDNNRTFTVSGSGYTEISGTMVDNNASFPTRKGSLTKSGAGTLTLTGNNTYSGTTTVSAGTLRLLGSNSSSGGTTLTAGTLELGGTSNGGLASGTLTVGNATAGVAIIEAVGGDKTISNNMDFLQGQVTVSGSYSLQVDGTFSNSGGARTLTNNIVSGKKLTLAGPMTITTTYSMAFTGTGDTTISGDIGSTGTGELKYTGSGTLLLSGDNTYSGTTTVSGGTLVINGTNSGGGTVNVNAGGTLGGTGTVSGAVTAAAGGTIDFRDDAVGTFGLGSLTLSGTAANSNNLYFDLGNGAGGIDKIVVAGAHSAAAVNGAIIHLNQLSGDVVDSGTYTLIQGGAASNFTGYALLAERIDHMSYSLGASGNNLQLTVAAGEAGPADAFSYWKGGTSAWNTAQWYSDADATTPAAGPGYSSNVRFAASSPGNLTNILGRSYEINSLTVDSGIAATRIVGSMMVIDASGDNSNTPGNGITVNNAAGTILECGVGLADSQTWTVGADASLTVTGAVTDFNRGFSLTKAGAGRLTLRGANTYGGETTISGGVLQIGGAGSLNGGSYAANITNNGTFQYSSSASQTILGAISGGGTLIKDGPGTLILDFANMTAPTNLVDGSSPLVVGGGTLQIKQKSGATTSQTFNGTTINPGASTIAATNVGGSATETLTLNLGSISRNAGGVVNFALPTSGQGNTTTGTGNDASGVIGRWATTGVTTNLQYAANDGSGNIIAYAGATAATAGTLANMTNSGANYSFGAAATVAPGSALKGNTLRYTGGAGTLEIGAEAGTENTLTLNGLVQAGSGALTIQEIGSNAEGGLVIGDTGELVIVTNNQGLTITSVIQDGPGGPGAVTFGSFGGGQLTFGTDNTYSGGTIIGGTVSASIDTTTALGTGPVTMLPGSIVKTGKNTLSNEFIITDARFNSGNSYTSHLAGNMTIYGVLNLNYTGGGNANVTGDITGPGSLYTTSERLNNSCTKLHGTNTYAGTTEIIANGALEFVNRVSLYGGDTTKWTAENLIINSGGTAMFGVGGAGQFTASDIGILLSLGTATGGFTNNTSIAFDTAGGDFTYTGVIADTNGGANKLGLTKFAGNDLILGDNNTYSGATVILRGTVVVSSINSVVGGAASSSLGAPKTVADGTILMGHYGGQSATLVYTGTGETTDRVIHLGSQSGGATFDQSGSGLLKFTSNITSAGNDNATITFRGAGDGEFAGIIPNVSTGIVTVVKNDSGTWTLSGANTYTGATRVYDGTLVISGSPIGNSAPSVYGGTLKLDYSANNDSKIHDSAVLTLRGGTLELAGDGVSDPNEVVASTTLTAATSSSVIRTSGAARLVMGAIGRSAGAAINFGAENIATTTNANVNGILGPWATIGEYWATKDGNGSIVAYKTGFTDIDARGPGSTIGNDSTANVRIVGDGTSGNVALGAATTTVNTLLQTNADFAATIDTAGKTLAINGIRIGAGKEAVTVGELVGDGTLKAAAAGGELFLINDNTAKVLTVNAVIADNSSASALTTKGNVTLNAANTHGGATTIGAGTVVLGNQNALQNSTLTMAGGGLVFDSSVVGNAFTFGGLASASAGAGYDIALQNNAGTPQPIALTVGGNNASTTYDGVLSGAGSLTKVGTGTLTLDGENTYAGATNVTAGTLTVSEVSTFDNTSQIVLTGTGRLNVDVTSQSLAKLAAGGGVPAGTFLRYSRAQTAAGTGPGTILGTVELNANNVNADYVLDFGNGATFTTTGNNTYNSPITVSGNSSIDSVNNVFTCGAGMTVSASTPGAKTLTLTGANTGASIIRGAISNGSGKIDLNKTGTGKWTLAGVNTYTGDTVVTAGTLALADNAQLTFVIGANGVNNDITGTGTLSLAGDFYFDLTGAGQAYGDSWMIVDTYNLAVTYESTFKVVGFAADAGGDKWTKAIDVVRFYEFTESTGLLKVSSTSLPGDTNGDKVVDAFDFITLKKNFGAGVGGGVAVGNFDNAGTVNWTDLNILTTNFSAGGGTPAVTPEPATLGLLALGALAVVRRRRRK